MSLEREHALLSASGSKRWLECTPSARLEDTLPEEPSEFAEEGSLAHEIGELKLRAKYIEPMTARTLSAKMKKLKAKPLYNEEMQGYTDKYVEYIDTIVHSYNTKPYLALEVKLDYSDWAQEGFGTSDFTICCSGDLHIVDLKYGVGVAVEAPQNTQMICYALGAYKKYNFIQNFRRIIVHIVQPRLNSYTSWELTPQELLDWGELIKPKAALAWLGIGEFKAGEHCRFCRAKYTCRARSEFFLAFEEARDKQINKGVLLSNEEIGDIIIVADLLRKWSEDLKKYALKQLIQGFEFPGWKLVAGKGKRAFKDIDGLLVALAENGWDCDLFITKDIAPLTEIEKIVGVTEFKKIAKDYIEWQEGGPTLALISDNREPYKKLSAAEFFTKLDNKEGDK